MSCYERQHNESLEDSLGTEVFLWGMLQPPRDSKLVVVLLETGGGICLQVILTLVTSLGCCSHQFTCRTLLPTSCQPASVTSQRSYALNKADYPVSPYCHDSSTVSWCLHNGYENQILSCRKSTLYSSYYYCKFINQSFLMLPDSNCSLWCMHRLAQLRFVYCQIDL